MKRKTIGLVLTVGLVACSISGCGNADAGAETAAEQSETAGDEEAGAGGQTQPAESSQDETPASDVVLEWETTATSEKIPTYEEIIADFTAQTGIKVELATPGSDYETVMKTRMASGDLPDIWETHGWSVTRYSDYLATLNDSEWFDRVDESILPVISDQDGNIYCLPLTQAINTITYNKNVFEKAGVDAYSILTWDDFGQACEKIKSAGFTPIYCGNKDSSTIAQLCESIPPAFLTLACVEDNQAAALKDGSFDFVTYWMPIAKMVDEWMQAGYFNEDILTSDNDAACQALANDECGMVFGGGNNILFAQTYNPDASLGYLACPGVEQDDTCFLSMTEGTCVGIWKDTEYPEECRQFLAYLAQKDICEKVATASGDIPGLKDVTNEEANTTIALRETQKAYEGHIEYVPLFDREYLPSGMWDDLGVGMTKIIMNPGSAVEECASYLQDAYDNKMAQ